jgi:hypothetical protein
METKFCVKCEIEKTVDEFYVSKTSKKPISYCVLCNKELQKKYREINKNKNTIKKSEWYKLNKPKLQKKAKENYIKNIDREKTRSINYHRNNKEEVKLKKQKYYKQNKLKIINRNNQNIKLRKKIDPIFRLKVNIRTRLYNDFKKGGFNKNSKSYIILGCSFEKFKEHLESKFESWMTWDNYGLYNGELNHGWDIDHIIPSSTATNEEDVIRLNHYSNLQPLCSKVNRDIKKSNH